MHISWDTAGCLCPVGDFFNYAPPEEGPHLLGESKATDTDSFSHITSCDKGERAESSTKKVVDAKTDRLTDAGYDEALGSYCFYAKRNYERGDQVLLSYGTYTNLELLEHYGFILQENPNDKAFISLEAEMYSLCSWPNDSLYISLDGKPSFALLSTVRLWATPVSKRRSVKQRACSGQLISIDNEVAVMEWTAKRCRAVLSSCSTSIDQDVQLLIFINNIQDYNGEAESSTVALSNEIRAFLESNSVDAGKITAKTRRSISRWELAVQWRHRYKRILSDCISYCSDMLDNLSVI